MLRNLRISLLYTLATTVLFGVLYPLVVTSAAQLLFKDKANGQLIQKKGAAGRLEAHRSTLLSTRLLPLAPIRSRQWL